MLNLLVPGCSVVWLARLLWEQEVVSSNLTIRPLSFNHFPKDHTRLGNFSWNMIFMVFAEELIELLKLSSHPEEGGIGELLNCKPD